MPKNKKEEKPKISDGDKYILSRYNHEITTENPFCYNNLERLALRVYLGSTDDDNKPLKGVNTGERIYSTLFNYVKDSVYALKATSSRGERRIEKIVKEDLGLDKDSLEDLFRQKRPITPRDFYNSVCKPTADRLNKVLSENSTAGLTPNLLNDGVREYLVKEAKKVKLTIEPENIVTIEDLRNIARAIIEANTVTSGMQESLLDRITRAN